MLGGVVVWIVSVVFILGGLCWNCLWFGFGVSVGWWWFVFGVFVFGCCRFVGGRFVGVVFKFVFIVFVRWFGFWVWLVVVFFVLVVFWGCILLFFWCGGWCRWWCFWDWILVGFWCWCWVIVGWILVFVCILFVVVGCSVLGYVVGEKVIVVWCVVVKIVGWIVVCLVLMVLGVILFGVEYECLLECWCLLGVWRLYKFSVVWCFLILLGYFVIVCFIVIC